MTLQRLIIAFKPRELVVHMLYRNQNGPGPNTKGACHTFMGVVSYVLRSAVLPDFVT